MKLATLDDGTRDGALAIVSADGARLVSAVDIAPTLQTALDNWERVHARLRARYDMLNGGAQPDIRPAAGARLHAPLPRAYEWIDGSAFINHVVLVRRARNAEPPETLRTDPLVYQGGSGCFLRPTDDLAFPTEDWGIDFESEVAVIVGDVPRATKAADAHRYIRLLVLVNDVTLRNLIPTELAKGFGFLVSKPSSALAPFAITVDELGGSWRDGRVHLPLVTRLNGATFGDPNAGPEMHFSFFDLIEHVTRTRPLTAGTLIGSGTVSNAERARGSSCLVERRMIETIEMGTPITPYLRFGDEVEIEMRDDTGRSLFGAIRQRVTRSET